MIANATETPAEFANATMDVTGGFANSMGLMPASAFVLYGALIIGVVSYVTGNYRRYSFIVKAANTFAETVEYAIKGAAAVVGVGVTFAPLWLLAQTDGETQGLVLTGLGAVVGGYIALAAIGYVADRLYQRAKDQHDMYERVHSDQEAAD